MNRKDIKKIVREVLLENRNNEIQSLENKIAGIKTTISEEFGIEENDPDSTLLSHMSPDEPDPEWHRKHARLTSLANKWETLQNQLDILNRIDPNKPSKGELERQGNYRRGERIAAATAGRAPALQETYKPSLKIILKEMFEQEEASNTPNVEFPDWLENKIKTVHGEPGQGSIFSNPDSVKNIVLQLVKEKQNEIANIANTTGTLKTNVANIGYDLVLPTEEANRLPDANTGTTTKVEGPNKIEVPLVQTSAPLSKFSTDQLTVIVRPKKDASGTVIPNEYIILSAFPGKDLPRTSEWNGKYSIIKPNAASPSSLQEGFTMSRWKKLAGII